MSAYRAVQRDASWYSYPGFGGRYHVVTAEAFSADLPTLCGIKAYGRDYERLEDVPESLRCRRRACAKVFVAVAPPPTERGSVSDQSEWPAHLRDDAPYCVCSGCGRHSWGADEGQECKFPQPDGSTCPGVFGAEVAPPPTEENK